jgi:hypothetical protein
MQKAWRESRPEGFAQKERERLAVLRRVPELAAKKVAQVKAWRRRNPQKVAAQRERMRPLHAECERRRTATKLQATPAWADPAAMQQYYHEAARLTRETGLPHEVDHIVPLRGREVCGFHVQNNLRVIPATINRDKAFKLIHSLLEQPHV